MYRIEGTISKVGSRQNRTLLCHITPRLPPINITNLGRVSPVRPHKSLRDPPKCKTIWKSILSEGSKERAKEHQTVIVDETTASLITENFSQRRHHKSNPAVITTEIYSTPTPISAPQWKCWRCAVSMAT